MPKGTQLPRLEEIELARIREDTDQPRAFFEPHALDELAKSLRTQGQQTPLLVRRSGKNFFIIAGHRRWRAAGRAGLKGLWCIVVAEAKKNEVRVRQLHEIVHHKDHHPVELAMVLWKLKQQTNKTNEKLGVLVEKKGPWVSQHLGVVERVAPEILAEFQTPEVPCGMEALIQISRVDGHDLKKELWAKIKNGLTIRELRAEIKKVKGLFATEQPGGPGGINDPSDEVRVHFNNILTPIENLRAVIQILRDSYAVSLDDVRTALSEAFGMDMPDINEKAQP